MEFGAAASFNAISSIATLAHPFDDFLSSLLFRELYGCKAFVFPSQDEISRTHVLLGDRVARFPLSSSSTQARLTNGSGADVEMMTLTLECLAVEQRRLISQYEFW
jgi:hypothetical protein